ncbi:MAG: hypothetical protein RLO50_15565 [Azospirillaceae bacterium]
MADLQQIVGAILRDLAKARFSADLYSRSISRYYEGDALLRKFPVPRGEIEEVELDLKFTIAEVSASHVDGGTREANTAVVLERGVERLVATFMDVAREFTDSSDNTGMRDRLHDVLGRGFNSTVLRVELRQQLMRFFIDNYPQLIDDEGRFAAADALSGMARPMGWAFADHRREGYSADDVGEAMAPVFDHVLGDDRFRSALEALGEPIAAVWRDYSDTRLDVAVDGPTLSELADSAVSTLKIKASVRNMVWAEVKVDEHTYRYTLTGE